MAAFKLSWKAVAPVTLPSICKEELAAGGDPRDTHRAAATGGVKRKETRKEGTAMTPEIFQRQGWEATRSTRAPGRERQR